MVWCLAKVSDRFKLRLQGRYTFRHFVQTCPVYGISYCDKIRVSFDCSNLEKRDGRGGITEN